MGSGEDIELQGSGGNSYLNFCRASASMALDSGAESGRGGLTASGRAGCRQRSANRNIPATQSDEPDNAQQGRDDEDQE